MNKKSKSYLEYLRKDLKNPLKAADYLNAGVEEKDSDIFLIALEHVSNKRIKKTVTFKKVVEILSDLKMTFSIKLSKKINSIKKCRIHGELDKKLVYADRKKYRCKLCHTISTKKYLLKRKKGK